MVQWLRAHLPVWEKRVWSLSRKDPTCHGATKPMHHSYWARGPTARALQQEKPPQWEACTLQLEKACMQQRRPRQAKKINKWFETTTTFRQMWYTTNFQGSQHTRTCPTNLPHCSQMSSWQLCLPNQGPSCASLNPNWIKFGSRL